MANIRKDMPQDQRLKLGIVIYFRCIFVIFIEYLLTPRLSTIKKDVNKTFTNQFGILGLPETWIMPDELYKATVVLVVFCFFLF